MPVWQNLFPIVQIKEWVWLSHECDVYVNVRIKYKHIGNKLTNVQFVIKPERKGVRK